MGISASGKKDARAARLILFRFSAVLQRDPGITDRIIPVKQAGFPIAAVVPAVMLPAWLAQLLNPHGSDGLLDRADNFPRDAFRESTAGQDRCKYTGEDFLQETE